jgi:hypothetical protein
VPKQLTKASPKPAPTRKLISKAGLAQLAPFPESPEREEPHHEAVDQEEGSSKAVLGRRMLPTAAFESTDGDIASFVAGVLEYVPNEERDE